MTTAETPDEPWRAPVARLSFWRVVPAAWLGLVLFVACDSSEAPKDWVGAGTNLALYVIPLGWWLVSARRRRYSLPDVMGRRPTGQHLVLAVIAVLAVLGVRVGWLAYLTAFDLIPSYWPDAEPDPVGPLSIWTSHLTAVVLGPLVEEVMFRGLVFRRLLRHTSPIRAALYSSVLFGLLHFDIAGSVLFGLVMLVLYLRTGSLWVPVAAHAFFNLLGSQETWLEALVSSSPWVLVALQLTCVPWLVWFLRGPYRLGKPPSPAEALA